MRYKQLYEFIQEKMRMSAIYQPAMLMALLKNGGSCSRRQIAKALLAHDESQIEYYEAIVANMVGKVLTNHGVVKRDKNTKTYTLLGFERLTDEQRRSLNDLCKQKIDAFMAARGSGLYDHRRKSAGYISGTI